MKGTSEIPICIMRLRNKEVRLLAQGPTSSWGRKKMHTPISITPHPMLSTKTLKTLYCSEFYYFGKYMFRNRGLEYE